MNYVLATNDQLWIIMKSDWDCPLPLLEGIFQEAVNRGMIKQIIISVMKEKRLTNERTQSIIRMEYEDLVQLGYEGAVNALIGFSPGKGSFVHFLYLKISQTYGKLFEYEDAEKRKRNDFIPNDGMEMEFYFVDYRTNVEKIVLNKIRLEEKLSLLNPIQKETLLRFFQGYTLQEIAEQMNTKKCTAHARLTKAMIKMTGKKVDFRKLGVLERPTLKGA
jgi:RNA polymerase sigma factor (sigma-70 family)